MEEMLERLDELRDEAKRLGIEDEVHLWNPFEAIIAYAELLGYDPYLATDPEVPLTRGDVLDK